MGVGSASSVACLCHTNLQQPSRPTLCCKAGLGSGSGFAAWQSALGLASVDVGGFLERAMVDWELRSFP